MLCAYCVCIKNSYIKTFTSGFTLPSFLIEKRRTKNVDFHKHTKYEKKNFSWLLAFFFSLLFDFLETGVTIPQVLFINIIYWQKSETAVNFY
jgi:hypothetical protein